MKSKTAVVATIVMSVLCVAFIICALSLRPSGPWNIMLAVCALACFPPFFLLANKLGITHGAWQHFLFTAVVMICALTVFFFRNSIAAQIYKVPGDTGSSDIFRTTEYDEDTSPGNETASQFVYISETGKKYHTSFECAGQSAKKISLSKAVGQGYGACKKCADG